MLGDKDAVQEETRTQICYQELEGRAAARAREARCIIMKTWYQNGRNPRTMQIIDKAGEPISDPGFDCDSGHHQGTGPLN